MACICGSKNMKCRQKDWENRTENPLQESTFKTLGEAVQQYHKTICILPKIDIYSCRQRLFLFDIMGIMKNRFLYDTMSTI